MLVNKTELYNILLANKNVRTGAIEFVDVEELKDLIFEAEIDEDFKEWKGVIITNPLNGCAAHLLSHKKVNYIPDLKQYILDKFKSKFSKNELLNLHALLDGGLDLCDILGEYCCEVAPEYFVNPECLKEEV